MKGTQEKFYLERFLLKITPNYTLSAFLITTLNFILSIILVTITGEILVFLSMIPNYLGSISFFLAMVMMKRVRDHTFDALEVVKSLVNSSYYKELNTLKNKIFTSSLHLLVGLLLGIVGFMYIFYWYIVKRQVAPLWSTLIAAQSTIWCFFYYFQIGMLFTFCIGAIFMVYCVTSRVTLNTKILAPGPQIISLKKLGELGLEVSLAWSFSVGINSGPSPFLFGFKYPSLAIIAGFVVLIIVAVASFLIPIFRIHSLMKRMKEDGLRDLGDKFINSLNTIQSKINKKERPQLRDIYLTNLCIIALYQLDKIGEWPFDFESIAKFVITVPLPIVSFLISNYRLILVALGFSI